MEDSWPGRRDIVDGYDSFHFDVEHNAFKVFDTSDLDAFQTAFTAKQPEREFFAGK